jgi:hypothetical protein
MTSTNDRAAELVGERPTGLPFDQPAELGYWCPVCRVPPETPDSYDDRLHWSQYNGFLWCEVCDFDYPSALCVQLIGEPEREWQQVGRDAAVTVYLNTIRDAVARAFDSKLVVDPAVLRFHPYIRRVLEACAECTVPDGYELGFDLDPDEDVVTPYLTLGGPTGAGYCCQPTHDDKWTNGGYGSAVADTAQEFIDAKIAGRAILMPVKCNACGREAEAPAHRLPDGWTRMFAETWCEQCHGDFTAWLAERRASRP